MTIPFDPARTAAVVVGIEKYAAGDRWSLTGPAFDAVRFVEWLRARDVPANNIHLFLSPLDQHEVSGEIDKRLNAPSVSVTRRGSAKTEPIRTLFQDDFNALAASVDTLFVFWGGHGAVQKDKSRRLFCENAKTSNLYPINAGSLLEMLSSNPWNSMRNQVVVIDACANYYEEMSYRKGQAEVAFSSDDSVGGAGFSQLVLFSAANGEAALNDPIKRSGAFSQRFFDEIDKSPLDAWPDFEAVGRKIAESFRATANEDGEGEAQHPVMFRWENSQNAGEQVGALPISKELRERTNQGDLRIAQLWRLVDVALAPSSLGERVRRDALVAQLEALGVPSIARKPDAPEDLLQIFGRTVPVVSHYQQLQDVVKSVVKDAVAREDLIRALDAVHVVIVLRRKLSTASINRENLLRHYRASLPDAQLNDPVNTLDEIVESLCNLSPRSAGAVPPCIEFAERIGQASGNADLCAWVDSWCASVGQTGALISLRQQLLADEQRARQGHPTLFIDVSNVSDATDTPSSLRYHVYDASGKPLGSDTVWLERHAGESVEISRNRAMADALQAASQMVAGDSANSKFVIEVFVSLDQMMWAFDQWKTTPDDEDSGTFGRSYPLIIRWIERMRPSSKIVVPDRRNAWTRAAKNIREHVSRGQKPAPYWIAKDDQLLDTLEDQIKVQDFKSVVFLEFVPGFGPTFNVERRLVKAALCGGAPYVLWWRCTPTRQSLQNEFDDILNSASFDTLSSRSAAMRLAARGKQGSFGESLVVLWDDPERTPPDLKFVHPQQRGP